MITLIDIRCGCGGLCDSNVICPMAANEAPCRCGAVPVHSQHQHDLVLRQEPGTLAQVIEQIPTELQEPGRG